MVSIVLIIMSSIAFKMRRSVHLLGFYLVILFLIFAAELAITITLIFNEDILFDAAKKYYDKDKIDVLKDQINAHIH